MENFEEYMNSNTPQPAGLDIAFKNTYKIVTGKLSIKKVTHNSHRDVFLLYDPFYLDIAELKDILNDIIDFYIETEEYEKCQELKNLLNSDPNELKELIEKITLKDTDVVSEKDSRHNGLNSIDSLIDLFKQHRDFDPNKIKNAGRWPQAKHGKKYIPQFLSDMEMWSLMKKSDKNIFENNYTLFTKWTSELENEDKKYYSERLINGISLLPIVQEDIYNISKNTYDYNSLVVSIIDEFICISNYSSERINKLQKLLKGLGVNDSEIRIKLEDDVPIYTLVYSSKQPPPPPGK